MAVFALIFAVSAALKTYAGRRQHPYAKYIPSGIAFAIGFLNTPSFSLGASHLASRSFSESNVVYFTARLVGGLTEYLYYRRRKDSGDITLVIIARFVSSRSIMQSCCCANSHVHLVDSSWVKGW